MDAVVLIDLLQRTISLIDILTGVQLVCLFVCVYKYTCISIELYIYKYIDIYLSCVCL